jgi:chemotaxis family two-component system sensor kinase Cph1
MSEDGRANTSGGVVDMEGQGVGARRTHLRLYGWSLVLGWTLAVIGLLMWSLVQKRQEDIHDAETRADVARQKDISYRSWVQKHGGVYVPVSSRFPPNEYLRVPERDITTPSGKQLTLVNSSYMARQVIELAGDNGTVRTHMTSLKPLRPDNKADAGETKALHEFERGVKEVVWREWMGGIEYLRTMRPYMVEQDCLKCHAQQGYKVGDLRGGIATSVALPTVARSMATVWPTFVGFGLLWIAGSVGIGVAWRSLSRQEQQGEQIDARLRYAASHDTLTGLANRAMLMEHLSSAIEQMHREGRKFAVLFWTWTGSS